MKGMGLESESGGRTTRERTTVEVEFRRISLTGFHSCTSRSQYRSVSKQTTRYERIINISYPSTNKAFETLEDSPYLEPPLNKLDKLLTSLFVIVSPNPCLHARIEPVELVVLDHVTSLGLWTMEGHPRCSQAKGSNDEELLKGITEDVDISEIDCCSTWTRQSFQTFEFSVTPALRSWNTTTMRKRIKMETEKSSINKFSSSLFDQKHSVFRDISGKYVMSGYTTALKVVPWETDAESVLREAMTNTQTPPTATIVVNTTGAPVTNTVANHAEKPEKFNGQNFKRWQQKMFFYHTTLGLVRFLKETAPQVEPPTEGQSSNAQAVQAVEAWKHSDFLCHNYVLNGLIDPLIKVLIKVSVSLLTSSRADPFIKVVRSDRGGEYVAPFAELCAKHGIRYEFTAPYSPGIAERKNRTLKEMVTAMLISSGMSQDMWGEAILMATYLLRLAILSFNYELPRKDSKERDPY
ncbi:pol polyprotein [Tanacetum coccineum]